MNSSLNLKRTFLIITLLFVLVAVITSGVGFANYTLSRVTSRHAESLTKQNLPALEELAGLQEAALRYNVANTEFVLAKDEAGMAAKAQAAEHWATELATHLERLGKLMGDPEVGRLSVGLRDSLESYHAAAGRLQAALKGGDFEKAMTILDNDVAKAKQALDTDLTALSKQCFAVSNASGTAAVAAVARNLRITLTLTAIVASVIAFAMVFVPAIASRISRRVATQLDALADGSVEVRRGASSLTSGSESLAEGASRQAANLEEISASLVEMSSMTKRNADGAQSAKGTAMQARETADRGATQMAAMQSAMVEINEAGAEITKILKTIDEIAFQTNLLALNAAVEAARAGEAGAGFAVVAEEVRSLAQRSATAAKETAAKIENSVSKGAQGLKLSTEARESFDKIQQQVRQLDTLMGEIATASSEQNEGIIQLNTAVSQMDKVTQMTAANAEETAAAAKELNSQAAALHDAVTVLDTLAGARTRERAAAAIESAPPEPLQRPVIGRTVTAAEMASEAHFQ